MYYKYLLLSVRFLKNLISSPQKDAFCRILTVNYHNLSAQGHKMMLFQLENDELLRNRGVGFPLEQM